MRTALVDIAADSPLAQSAGAQPFFPSIGLLRCGSAAVRAGEDVFYHRLSAAALSGVHAASVPAPLAAADRLLISAPGAAHRAGEALRAAHPHGAQIIDAATAALDEIPNYALTRGHASCQAEIDVAPWWAPAHPWALAETHGAIGSEKLDGDSEARLQAAAASLIGVTGASLYINDPRRPVDMDRLRLLARVVQGALDTHNTLCGLHLRIWPQDLLRDERLADNLTLLPLESLELLIGSIHPAATASDPRVGSVAAVHAAISCLQKSGLSHLASLSLSVGLPGERAEECVDGMNLLVGACAAARIRRLRIAVYLGAGAAPKDAADQHARFLASHPDWHPMEYRALFDMAVLLQSAVPELTLIGPGWQPTWEPPTEV